MKSLHSIGLTMDQQLCIALWAYRHKDYEFRFRDEKYLSYRRIHSNLLWTNAMSTVHGYAIEALKNGLVPQQTSTNFVR